jgi:hypothetical protein
VLPSGPGTAVSAYTGLVSRPDELSTSGGILSGARYEPESMRGGPSSVEEVSGAPRKLHPAPRRGGTG